jgi:hypothetical protein
MYEALLYHFMAHVQYIGKYTRQACPASLALMALGAMET